MLGAGADKVRFVLCFSISYCIMLTHTMLLYVYEEIERPYFFIGFCILITKMTAEQNELELSYHRVRGLYFLAVIFAVTIVL